MSQKRMLAKYNGRCSLSGAPIYRGDDIVYDTVTRKTWLSEHGDCGVYLGNKKATISDVFNIGGKEFYRNKGGRCIDAPCCGCCTI